MKHTAISALLVVGTLFPWHAGAISSVRNEDVLCNASHIVVARIEEASATPVACFQHSENYCQCSLKMVAEIQTVLGINKIYPEVVGISKGKKVQIISSEAQFPPAPLTANSCQELQSSLLGADRIFSFSIKYETLDDGSLHASRPPYLTTLWPTEKQTWITELLAHTCASMIPKSK